MQSVEVQTLQSTVKEIDSLPRETVLLKRYLINPVWINFFLILKSRHIDIFLEQVTKRVGAGKGEWNQWNWRSQGDLLLNGAYFTSSGAGASSSYARASSLAAKSSSLVGMLTYSSGALKCRIGTPC